MYNVIICVCTPLPGESPPPGKEPGRKAEVEVSCRRPRTKTQHNQTRRHKHAADKKKKQLLQAHVRNIFSRCAYDTHACA